MHQVPQSTQSIVFAVRQNQTRRSIENSRCLRTIDIQSSAGCIKFYSQNVLLSCYFTFALGLGCTSSHSAAPQLSQENNNFDAGLLLPGRSTVIYLPVPLGFISNIQEIRSVSTSCECLQASVVRCNCSQGSGKFALQCVFRPKSTLEHDAKLTFVVQVKASSGVDRSFFINAVQIAGSADIDFNELIPLPE